MVKSVRKTQLRDKSQMWSSSPGSQTVSKGLMRTLPHK